MVKRLGGHPVERTSTQPEEHTVKRALASLFALMFVFGMTTVAYAQADSADDEDAPRVIYKKRTEIDFDKRAIEGDLKGPGESFILEKRQATFNPLIKLRADFNPEIYQSIHEF